jgi:GDP-D-mannose dehydratase
VLTWLLTVVFVRFLLGNPAKAEKKLGWKRKCPFDELVKRWWRRI